MICGSWNLITSDASEIHSEIWCLCCLVTKFVIIKKFDGPYKVWMFLSRRLNFSLIWNLPLFNRQVSNGFADK